MTSVPSLLKLGIGFKQEMSKMNRGFKQEYENLYFMAMFLFILLSIWILEVD